MKLHDITTSAKRAHVIRPSAVMDSSKSYSWNGILLEYYEMAQGELPERIIDNHVLWHWKTAYTGEYEARRGHFVRCVKTAGAISVTPVGVVPALHSHTCSELLMCTLDADFIKSLLLESDTPPTEFPIFRPNFHDAPIQHLLNLLMNEIQEGNPYGRIYVESLTHALAIRYLFLGDGPDEIRSESPALPGAVLKRVLEHIRSESGSELSLLSLAKEAGYSRGYFLKMFHTATGMTPHRYILNFRVEQAKELLKNSEIALIDIAASCGFSNHAHLSRVFRRFTGVTPSNYRRNS